MLKRLAEAEAPDFVTLNSPFHIRQATRWKLLVLLLCLLARLTNVQSAEITGKVICGYQGWFRTPDDGTGNGWAHYTSGPAFEPGRATIDLWPDVSELPERDRVNTGYRHADGSVAQVFSSVSPSVMKLHFQWMSNHGIDGVFLQRFAVELDHPRKRASMDAVLHNVSVEAEKTDRAWGIMYDLTGLAAGQAEVIINDWKRLKSGRAVAGPRVFPNFLEHDGKPLVALWGFGFSDRPPMWDDWKTLIAFFKEEQNCAVLLGVPTYWREMKQDARDDALLHELLRQVDIVSPWTVGRYGSAEAAQRHISTVVSSDLEWCEENGLAYMPVSFPGFSWQNLMKSRGQNAELGAIPREGGRFLWSQLKGFSEAGAKMLYIAMFDELDEGTAIMKWDNSPPVGETQFLTEPGVPDDHYLWLTGMAGRLLRGEQVAEEDRLPARSGR